MGLVSTWLNGIGLGHAVPSFKAAGIVTPSALAELELIHYEALGVKDDADRRKLFYLVQRIKLAVDPSENSKEEEEWASQHHNQDGMIASTVESAVVLDESEKDDAVVPRTRRRKSTRNSEPIQARFSSKSNRVQPESRLLKENLLNNSPSKRVQPSRTATAADRKSSTGVSVRRSSRATRKADDAKDDSDWEEESTDDTSRNSSTDRRSSQSLQNQHQTKRTTRSSISARKSAPTASTRRRSSGTVGSTSRRQSSDSLSSSTSRRRRSSSAQDLEDSSSSSNNKRTMPRPSTRRYESKLPNPSSKRTGKQLSTIPADSVAPMSPLVTLPKSRMDAAIASQQAENEKKKKKAIAARRKSFGGVSRSKSSSSLDGGKSGSDTESSSSSRRKSTGRQSTGSAASRRRSMGGRSGGLTKSSSLRSIGSDSGESLTRRRRSISATAESNSGPVFVHGMPVDDSWCAQVSTLREDNNTDHELFSGGNSVGNSLDDMRIRVVIRKRPMSKSEASSGGEIDVIHPLDYDDYGRVLVYQPKTRVDLTKEVESVPFAFDNVFSEAANNVQIYERTVRNLIPGVFDGQWASLFAYGQTGSGKTFTMMGCNLTGIKAGNSMSDESNSGLYYLAALDVFELANSPEYRHLSVGVSLFEIYGGKLFDLLNGRHPVKCLEDHKGQVCFPGLSEHPVTNAHQLMEVIEAGAVNRSTGSTSKNADSSRSHAVLQLSLRKKVGRKTNVEHGRLTFIDLAGSERGADTSKASRSTRLEGAEINQSLLSLKEVIRALATGDSMAHIPFRGSKLTQVLKQSFVGKNSRSVMIACVAPNSSNCEHTLNTLRYANRVKERDAETGHASVDAVCTRSKINMSRLSSLSDRPNSTSTNFMDENESMSEEISIIPAASEDDYPESWAEEKTADGDVDDEDSALLDDLLSPTDSSPTRATVDSAKQRQVAESLISTHRSVMTEMLGMVKKEMFLVNSTDTDRDNMQDYLEQLESLQEEQLSLISTLRESLLEYYASRGSNASHSMDDLDAILSDDSFEDLRDF